ncbi:hypothetical protein ACJX0J_018298, partial [Zea mays]
EEMLVTLGLVSSETPKENFFIKILFNLLLIQKMINSTMMHHSLPFQKAFATAKIVPATTDNASITFILPLDLFFLASIITPIEIAPAAYLQGCTLPWHFWDEWAGWVSVPTIQQEESMKAGVRFSCKSWHKGLQISNNFFVCLLSFLFNFALSNDN